MNEDFEIKGRMLIRYHGNGGNVVIPNSVTSIEDWAFRDCLSLTSVIIPDSVTTIGNGAFDRCFSLTSVTISSSVTSIEDWAFRDCKNLTSFIIPDSVKSIGNGAFSGCSSLTSITIPESVTSIGNYSFENCFGLISINVPKSVTHVGYKAFYNTLWLKKYPDDFIIIGANILIKYKGNDKEVTIPDNVTTIGSRAFAYCENLTSVTIGNSVISIGEDAFDGCESLTSVKIINNAISIGEDAFSKCSFLNSIQIGKIIYGVSKLDYKMYASGIDLNGEYKIPIISHCKNPETLSDFYTEDLLHELIKYCNENGLYENQVYFTNYRYSHYNSDIDTVIKKKLTFDDDTDTTKPERGETSLFG